MSVISVREIAVWKAELRLRFRFSHNLASRNTAETLIVTATTSNGAIGYGQALPRPYLTGETIETVITDVCEIIGPRLIGIDFSDGTDALAVALCRLQPIYRQADQERKTASYSALESAVVDAVGHAAGFSAIIPGDHGIKESTAVKATIPLVGVIPAASPSRAAWLARFLRLLGYTRFKIKVGAQAEADERRIKAVRKVLGADTWLSADANQAWTSAQAEQRIDGLRRHGIALLEEPLVAAEAAEADFRKLEQDWNMPLMADETLCTSADAEALLQRGSPSYWNIRAGKNGGFSGVRQLASMAKESGIRIYGGVLVGETSLLAAFGQRAVFCSQPDCMEYGFPRLFVKNDPFRGGPGGFSGLAYPPDSMCSGLGIRLHRKGLENFGFSRLAVVK